MAAPTKKREIQSKTENIGDNEEENSSSDSQSDCENENASVAQQVSVNWNLFAPISSHESELTSIKHAVDLSRSVVKDW